MKIQRAFKTELDLNNTQRTQCAQHAGAARYAYNWGLARKIAAHHAGEKIPTAIDLHRELNTRKKTDLAWMYESSKCAPQEALRNLDRAFDNFFRRAQLKKQGKLKGKVGFPQFKSKKRGLGGFRLTGSIRVFEKHIQLPRLGQLRLKERGYLPTSDVKALSATASEQAGRWFVSLQVEMDIPDSSLNDKPIAGVDLGIKAMATVSDGMVIANPRSLSHNLRKIKRLQKSVSRKVRGSVNRRKAMKRLARAHQRVANIRRDALHQATTTLAKTKSAIAIEDLNVSGMLKNHKLARAIADVGMGEFRRQLEYKATWYGSRVVVADRFFPSSKMCSRCQNVKEELSLGERVFKCEVCGFECDRDLNASLNLTRLAGSSPDTLNACGESVRPGVSPAILGEARTEPQSTRVDLHRLRRTEKRPMKRSDLAIVTKSIRLAPEEDRALKQISEMEHVSEAALMKKFVLEGIARRRLEQAIAAYRRGEIDLSAAARHAHTSVYHLLEELKARDITPEAANEKFLDGLRTLAELFNGSEALRRTLEQLRRQA